MYKRQVYSTYNVLDLNRILEFMTKIREEMESLSTQIKEKTSSLSSTDLSLIKEKLSSLKVEYDKYAEKVNFFHKQIIKAYPSASSKKFNEAFKVLKDVYKRQVYVNNLNYNNYNYLIIKIFDYRFIWRLLYYEI